MKTTLLIPAFLMLLWALPALAAETPATGQQGHVLGQSQTAQCGVKPGTLSDYGIFVSDS